MMRHMAMATLGIAFAWGGVVAAKEPIRLAPSSKWNVHYGNDSCHMARSFGEGDQKVVLVANRYQPGDPLRLSFTGKPAYTSRSEGTVQIRFGPVEAAQEVEFFPATSADKTPALVIRDAVRIAARSPAELAAFEVRSRRASIRSDFPRLRPNRKLR